MPESSQVGHIPSAAAANSSLRESFLSRKGRLTCNDRRRLRLRADWAMVPTSVLVRGPHRLEGQYAFVVAEHSDGLPRSDQQNGTPNRTIAMSI